VGAVTVPRVVVGARGLDELPEPQVAVVSSWDQKDCDPIAPDVPSLTAIEVFDKATFSIIKLFAVPGLDAPPVYENSFCSIYNALSSKETEPIAMGLALPSIMFMLTERLLILMDL